MLSSAKGQQFCFCPNVLTHCDFMTPYGTTELSHYWFRYGMLPESTKPLPEQFFD